MLFAITLAGVIALPFVFPHFYLTLITFSALSFITILARYKWKRLHSAFILPHFFCFLGFAAGSFIYHGALTGIVISIIGYLLCAWSSSKVSNTQEQNIGKETDLIPDSRPRELSEELFQVTRKDINSPIYFQKTYSDYQQVKFWRLPSFFQQILFVNTIISKNLLNAGMKALFVNWVIYCLAPRGFLLSKVTKIPRFITRFMPRVICSASPDYSITISISYYRPKLLPSFA
ncbi:hypothetical protein QNH14_22300 [Apirhabdus apintestini]|nr:hypothetical protein QNH14_22300 [Enterobacteriaceae bacterium CA-0114]